MQPIPPPVVPLEELYRERNQLRRAVLAPNTQKNYAVDWRMFGAWCERAGLACLPATADTVTLYLTDLLRSGRKVSTAIRRTSGIGDGHRQAGLPSPITADVWQLIDGARRQRREQPKRMTALTVDDVRKISCVLADDGSRRALRDRSLIVLGFASALRRCNLAQLTMEDVAFQQDGLVLRIRAEKQDQRGRGRTLAIPCGQHVETCPVTCLRDWLEKRGSGPGPLYTRVRTGHADQPLSGATVGRAVKLAVQRIGLDPKHYAGHSLRSGLITAAAEAGASELLIAAHTGHRSLQTLQRYFRRTDLFRSNVCAAIGL